VKAAYADCFSGISGDMFLAALLDAGLSIETLRAGIDALGLPEPVELRLTETRKGALRAASLEVAVPDSVHDRGLADILAILSGAGLPDAVKATAGRVFTLLAEAEARVHGETMEQVRFHEVGALDSIVDVVGAAIGLDALGIERLYSSPLPYGSGSVAGAHGPLPLPAPATLELLSRVHAPLTPTTAEVELITPTGAAILAALASFERPDIAVSSVGVGAGKRDLPWPNVMRLIVGEVAGPAADATDAAADATDDATEMVQLETNIDDMNPQFYGHVMEKLFAAGARDVWLAPIQMKKNRPGTLLGVIALRRDEAALAELILRETTTLGMRVLPIRRHEAAREFRRVETAYGTLSVKLKLIGGEVIAAVPEYDDCVRLAKENGVSLAEVYKAANEALAK
jgi:pyridinium-3,5-bisthiocarboxylic acid mononucleotide nickel chelatase